MKIVGLVGAVIGTKTLTAMERTLTMLENEYPQHEVTLIDISEYKVAYSDGRHYQEYTGDTLYITETLMAADALIVGTPTFQASIPGALKNIFDLLPIDGLKHKTVGIIVTAGTQKHFLMVEQQLKPILSYMKANLLPSYVFLEEADYQNKAIINLAVLNRLDEMGHQLVQAAEEKA